MVFSVCLCMCVFQLSLLRSGPAVVVVKGRMPGYICPCVLGSYYCLCVWVCVLILVSGHVKGTALQRAPLSESVCLYLSFCFGAYVNVYLHAALPVPGRSAAEVILHPRPRLQRFITVCVCVCLYVNGCICLCFLRPVNQCAPLKCSSRLFSQVWIHDSRIKLCCRLLPGVSIGSAFTAALFLTVRVRKRPDETSTKSSGFICMYPSSTEPLKSV